MKKADKALIDKALILAIVDQFGLKHNWYDFDTGNKTMKSALTEIGMSKTEASKLMKDYISVTKKKK